MLELSRNDKGSVSDRAFFCVDGLKWQPESSHSVMRYAQPLAPFDPADVLAIP